ncbi:MAG: PrsW family intramembrane metalloprotease [Melioribacteraceae bacterium]|nr:PrsW family intramembrane metalloprotease [Melioribacteraceae bacterium]
MQIMYSFIAALIPTVGYSLFIWKMDKYDREPLSQIFIHFLWGALGATIISIIFSPILLFPFTLVSNDAKIINLISSVLIAPGVEEFSKGLFLIYSINNKKFDNLTDGLVYGGAIGLGFGMTENFLYFITYGDTLNSWATLVIIRSGFSAVTHLLSTASFGAMIGLAKFSSKFFKFTLPIVGFMIAIFIHAIWNFSVSFEFTYFFGFLFIIISIIIFFVIFKLSLRGEINLILAELKEESDSGLIPVEDITFVTTKNIYSRKWINKKIRDNYTKSLVSLAFRKAQLKNSTGKNKEYIENELMQLRNYIDNINKNL